MAKTEFHNIDIRPDGYLYCGIPFLLSTDGIPRISFLMLPDHPSTAGTGLPHQPQSCGP